MATNAANDITYVLILASRHTEYLGSIRHWSNLRMATDGDDIFVKGFSLAQLNSLEVKSIPYKQLYDVIDQKLFPHGSALPSGRMPSSLLWSPIDVLLHITLPNFNHNFFGINQPLIPTLVAASEEHPAKALLLPMEVLGKHLNSVSQIRLQKLSWAIIDNDKAIIVGTPLLPIDGDTLWVDGDFLIPVGYEFDLPALSATVNQTINPENNNWVIWDTQSEYFLLEKKLLKPLSLSSYRLSLQGHFSVTETDKYSNGL